MYLVISRRGWFCLKDGLIIFQLALNRNEIGTTTCNCSVELHRSTCKYTKTEWPCHPATVCVCVRACKTMILITCRLLSLLRSVGTALYVFNVYFSCVVAWVYFKSMQYVVPVSSSVLCKTKVLICKPSLLAAILATPLAVIQANTTRPPVYMNVEWAVTSKWMNTNSTCRIASGIWSERLYFYCAWAWGDTNYFYGSVQSAAVGSSQQTRCEFSVWRLNNPTLLGDPVH